MSTEEWAAAGILAALVWYVRRTLKYKPWKQKARVRSRRG